MSDIDACLPAPLKDFVFDLHDSARRSFVVTEQEALYTGEFRELTSKVRPRYTHTHMDTHMYTHMERDTHTSFWGCSSSVVEKRDVL